MKVLVGLGTHHGMFTFIPLEGCVYKALMRAPESILIQRIYFVFKGQLL